MDFGSNRYQAIDNILSDPTEGLEPQRRLRNGLDPIRMKQLGRLCLQRQMAPPSDLPNVKSAGRISGLG